MQKHKLVQFIVLLGWICAASVFAQPDRWYRLYIDNQLAELEQLNSQGEISDQEWKTFFNILTEEKADEALSSYIKLYIKTNDNYLKKITLDRISQYYYAKGFYETATRIMEDADFRNRVFSIKKESIYFGVQVGAFASYQNALNMKNKISEKVADIKIMTKNRNGKKLHVVVAGKFETKNEALGLKKTIHQKFGYKGVIIQF